MPILAITAKCSDLCVVQLLSDDGKTELAEHDGYVPVGIGIDACDFNSTSYDYVEIEIDIATGQIVGWKPITADKIIKILKGTH